MTLPGFYLERFGEALNIKYRSVLHGSAAEILLYPNIPCTLHHKMCWKFAFYINFVGNSTRNSQSAKILEKVVKAPFLFQIDFHAVAMFHVMHKQHSNINTGLEKSINAFGKEILSYSNCSAVTKVFFTPIPMYTPFILRCNLQYMHE